MITAFVLIIVHIYDYSKISLHLHPIFTCIVDVNYYTQLRANFFTLYSRMTKMKLSKPQLGMVDYNSFLQIPNNLRSLTRFHGKHVNEQIANLPLAIFYVPHRSSFSTKNHSSDTIQHLQRSRATSAPVHSVNMTHTSF